MSSHGRSVLHEYAVDGEVDPDEESHVILWELPDHDFMGTVSSDNTYIPNFDGSQMQTEGMPEHLLEKAVTMVDRQGRKFMTKRYNFWSAYTCSKMGVEDYVVTIDDETSIVKRNYALEKSEELQGWIWKTGIQEWVWQSMSHPQGKLTEDLQGIHDKFMRVALAKSTLRDDEREKIRTLLRGTAESHLIPCPCYLHYKLFMWYNTANSTVKAEIMKVVIQAAFLEMTSPLTQTKNRVMNVNIPDWVIQSLANMDQVKIEILRSFITESGETDLKFEAFESNAGGVKDTDNSGQEDNEEGGQEEYNGGDQEVKKWYIFLLLAITDRPRQTPHLLQNGKAFVEEHQTYLKRITTLCDALQNNKERVSEMERGVRLASSDDVQAAMQLVFVHMLVNNRKRKQAQQDTTHNSYLVMGYAKWGTCLYTARHSYNEVQAQFIELLKKFGTHLHNNSFEFTPNTEKPWRLDWAQITFNRIGISNEIWKRFLRKSYHKNLNAFVEKYQKQLKYTWQTLTTPEERRRLNLFEFWFKPADVFRWLEQMNHESSETGTEKPPDWSWPRELQRDTPEFMKNYRLFLQTTKSIEEVNNFRVQQQYLTRGRCLWLKLILCYRNQRKLTTDEFLKTTKLINAFGVQVRDFEKDESGKVKIASLRPAPTRWREQRDAYVKRDEGDKDYRFVMLGCDMSDPPAGKNPYLLGCEFGV